MDLDLRPLTQPNSVSILNDPLASSGDGSMSDIEEDPDAADVVFPQASTLAKQHVLRPLVDALRALLARPQHLFVALLRDETAAHELVVHDFDVLEAKALAYKRAALRQALTREQWQRATDFVKRRSTAEDRWAQRELQQADDMMLKLTLYYSHLWEYTCAAAVRSVHDVETTAFMLYAEWSTAISKHTPACVPQDAAPTKLPPLEAALMCRPLRLRSQTAAALAATTTNTTSSTATGFVAVRPVPTTTVKESVNELAFRRARLARTSNEFLIAWFLHHKDKPYPSQSERVQIAKKTGLTEQQVRNWFANMRKRHWKPKADTKPKKPRCLLDTLLRKSEPTKA